MKYLKHNNVLKIVVYDRVSTNEQDERMNAKMRKKCIYKQCRKMNAVIIGYFYERAPGWSDQLHRRRELYKAVQMAVKNDAVILVPSVDRMIRTCTTRNTFAPLQEQDFDNLYEAIGEFYSIVSFIPPGTPPKTVRGRYAAWGQDGRGKRLPCHRVR